MASQGEIGVEESRQENSTLSTVNVQIRHLSGGYMGIGCDTLFHHVLNVLHVFFKI